MEKNAVLRNFVSGLFFIGGIIILLVMIFMIGEDKGLTQSKFKASILFRNVGGLIEGAPVQLAGVNVGTVSDINFLEEMVEGRRVKVDLLIFDRYRNQVTEGARFAIKTEGILGEKLIEVHGGEGPPADFSEPVIGEDALDVQDMAQVFSDAAQSFTNTSEDFSKVDVQELSKVLSDTAKTLSETSKGINGILTEMQYISTKSKRMLNRLEQRIIKGDLFKVF